MERFANDGGNRVGRGQAGRVRPGNAVFMLLFFAGGYLGVQALIAYVNYLALEDFVRLVARDVAMGPRRTEEAQERILAKAREWDIPVQENHVVVTVDSDKVQVTLRWHHPIGFGKYSVYFIPRTIEESRSLR
ncbi:MAG: hypothetical protein U1B94_01615 [candidate division NC10 bacterium]|nr:hypothetical protein [candidate division NC10 bacterium]